VKIHVMQKIGTIATWDLNLARRLGISLEQHGCLLEPGNRNVGDCDTKACRGLSGCATSGRH
jgi:hypothetical protein